MNIIREYKDFNNITEDKIMRFSDYEPTKYNGNMLVNQIMEWLRAQLLEEPTSDLVMVPLERFFSECSVDRDKFMTFYNEIDKTRSVNNFDIEIDGENISFKNFRNDTVEENKEQ